MLCGFGGRVVHVVGWLRGVSHIGHRIDRAELVLVGRRLRQKEGGIHRALVRAIGRIETAEVVHRQARLLRRLGERLRIRNLHHLQGLVAILTGQADVETLRIAHDTRDGHQLDQMLLGVRLHRYIGQPCVVRRAAVLVDRFLQAELASVISHVDQAPVAEIVVIPPHHPHHRFRGLGDVEAFVVVLVHAQAERVRGLGHDLPHARRTVLPARHMAVLAFHPGQQREFARHAVLHRRLVRVDDQRKHFVDLLFEAIGALRIGARPGGHLRIGRAALHAEAVAHVRPEIDRRGRADHLRHDRHVLHRLRGGGRRRRGDGAGRRGRAGRE